METGQSTKINSAVKQFKSYYVVWKRICECQPHDSPFGLNRTM